MSGVHTFYGLPHSLYTGPARAALRKHGVPFVERAPQDPAFARDIVPVIGRGIIPVLVAPDGQVTQDSVDIIDLIDGRGGITAYPAGGRQRLLALLFQFYGNHGLLRHAMHFRWSHYADQAGFIDHAFGLVPGDARAAATMARMRSYLPGLGVVAGTIPLIEASFDRLLTVLDAHFTVHPYLFGGAPSVGDYGLLGPLFAHLGRDPVPAGRMKRQAPALFRWVERMNAADPDLPDFLDHAAAFLPDDAVPPTLLPLVAHIGEELIPELADQIGFLAAWAAEHHPADGDPVSTRAQIRTLGTVATAYRGVAIDSAVAPYLLYLVARVRRQFAALGDRDRAWAEALLAPAGLLGPLTRDPGIGVTRRNHVEVWQTV